MNRQNATTTIARTAGMAAMTDPYMTRVADAAVGLIATQERVLAEKDAEIKAWKQIAYNLSCALELNGLHGIASLKQQMDAHGVTQ